MEKGREWSISLVIDAFDKYIVTFVHFTISQIKRVRLLLTVKDKAMELPANSEARRRISFFSTSLFMDMPDAPKVRNMLSFRLGKKLLFAPVVFYTSNTIE